MDLRDVLTVVFLIYLVGVVLGFNHAGRAFNGSWDFLTRFLTIGLFGFICSPLMLLGVLIILIELLLVTTYAFFATVTYALSKILDLLGSAMTSKHKERSEIWHHYALGNYFNRVRNDVRWLLTPKYEPSS